MNFVSSYGNPVCFIQQTSGAQHAGAVEQLDKIKSHFMEILFTLCIILHLDKQKSGNRMRICNCMSISSHNIFKSRLFSSACN